jgi:hypothetical protein
LLSLDTWCGYSACRCCKNQEGSRRSLLIQSWYRADWSLRFFLFPSHVPARGVPRQQKEREDLADGVTAMPACETYELLPLRMYLMYFILKSRRCYTVAFVAFVAFVVHSLYSQVHSFAVASLVADANARQWFPRQTSYLSHFVSSCLKSAHLLIV